MRINFTRGELRQLYYARSIELLNTVEASSAK